MSEQVKVDGRTVHAVTMVDHGAYLPSPEEIEREKIRLRAKWRDGLARGHSVPRAAHGAIRERMVRVYSQRRNGRTIID